MARIHQISRHMGTLRTPSTNRTSTYWASRACRRRKAARTTTRWRQRVLQVDLQQGLRARPQPNHQAIKIASASKICVKQQGQEATSRNTACLSSLEEQPSQAAQEDWALKTRTTRRLWRYLRKPKAMQALTFMSSLPAGAQINRTPNSTLATCTPTWKTWSRWRPPTITNWERRPSTRE